MGSHSTVARGRTPAAHLGRRGGRFNGVVEARWVQAGDGSFSGWGGPDNEDEQAILDQAYRIARRPDFNFTGWRAVAGVRWHGR